MDPSQVLDLNQTSTASFDAGYSILMVVVALALVFLNGFFVLSEFSIVKVRRSKLEEMVKEKKLVPRKLWRLLQGLIRILVLVN